MKDSGQSIRERINAIEKRIVELKFIERDIKRERDAARFPLLENAEKSARVESFLDSFFLKLPGVSRKSVSVTAIPSGYSGRGEEEFLAEIRVEMRYVPEEPGDFNELTLTVYLNEGFENDDVRNKESEMMDRLVEAEAEVERLREEKRGLRL